MEKENKKKDNEELLKKGISRRDFIKGAAAGAVGVATMGILGACTTDEPASSTAATSTAPGSTASDNTTTAASSIEPTTAAANDVPVTAAADDELIAAARLNPQDYDYRQNTTDFKTLFSPLKIGSIELSHRMIKSAAGSACYLAGLTEELHEYYLNFAKGGVEMIWMENVGELEPPVTGEEMPEATIAFGKRLVDECADYGAQLGYQWAPFGQAVGEMTVEDIAGIQDRGVLIAKSMQEMGFKALEINAAGFNQGAYFLSRFYNTRTDEYGIGSLENRARFVTECIQKIKQECGDDFVVQVLINCIEENDNLTNNATLATPDNAVTAPYSKVTTIEDGIEFAKLFEAAGCDSMHLRLGPLGNHPCQFGSDLYFILNGIEGATGFGTQWDFNRHWQGQLIGNHSGAGMLIDIVSRYKEAVSIPCGTVTYMDPAHAPDYFEQALADGKVDFYLMTRPLAVDSEYVNKLREGRIDEIAPCTRCLHCHIGSNQGNAAEGYCRVNAMTQRVYRELYTSQGGPTSYDLPPIDTAKKVMVVGGGPGGMEAARIAAARGHDVTLYEKKAMLGGLLEFASIVKGPHENLDDLKAYLIRQLEISGVNVVLSQEVDSDFINSEAPDAVILAAGGLNDELDISGDSSVQIVDFEQFMFTEMGDNVIVYGSNAQAFDCALWLTVHKKNVTIVTPNPNEELDKQQSQHAKRFMTTALYSLGVQVWPQASIKEIGNSKATITTETGVDMAIPCDAVINAADLLPNTALLEGITVSETYAVGDCANPFNIARAIQAGNDAGRAI